MPLAYPVKPIHPSPVVSWNNGNLTATRQFVVPSEYVDDFIEYLLNSSTVCSLPTTFPGWSSVFVDSIQAEPISPCCFVSPDGLGYLEDPAEDLEGYPSVGASGSGGLNDANDTCWWKVVVGYQTKEITPGQSGVREGTWLSYDRSMSGSMESIPSAKLFWESNGALVREDSRAAIFVPVGDINVIWNFVTWEDMCEIEPQLLYAQGKVNDSAWGAITLLDGCASPWPAECVLFFGYNTSYAIETKKSFGSYCVSIDAKRNLSLNFKLRMLRQGSSVYGWNYKYNDDPTAGSTGLDRPLTASGATMYQTANFNNIFV